MQVESLLAKLPGKPTKLLGLTSEFNKTSGYKDNPQISIAFLYTNSEKSKKEIKRTTLNKWFWEKWTTFCHPHGLQHTRLPCPSPSPGACSNSCPLSLSIHLILFCPLLLLPSIFPSIRVFFNELALRIRWSKYWSFSFSISSSNEYSQLISIRIDWFDLLVVQGTLKGLHAKERNGIFT